MPGIAVLPVAGLVVISLVVLARVDPYRFDSPPGSYQLPVTARSLARVCAVFPPGGYRIGSGVVCL